MTTPDERRRAFLREQRADARMVIIVLLWALALLLILGWALIEWSPI